MLSHLSRHKNCLRLSRSSRRLSSACLLSACLVSVSILGSEVAMSQTAGDASATPAVSSASSAPVRALRGQLGWRTQLGVGLIVNPESVGGEDYNVTPIPFFDFRYLDERGTKYFANVPQGLGGYFYRERSPGKGRDTGRFLNIGAGIAPGFNVRDDSTAGVEEIGISTEARLYLEAGGKKWSAGATLAQDIGSGHEGAYLDLSLARRGAIGKRGGFYTVGPVLRVGDDTYKAAFFNTGARQISGQTVPPYSADGGVERVGLQGLISLPLGDSKWRWTSIIRGSQLIGDAADSPIVVNETQLFFLSSITRSF